MNNYMDEFYKIPAIREMQNKWADLNWIDRHRVVFIIWKPLAEVLQKQKDENIKRVFRPDITGK